MSNTKSEPQEDGGPSSNSTKDFYGGGPTINGTLDAMLTPELLYKMNKKIAQLTKVVYGLNTRGEEMEAQLSACKETEDKLRIANNELQSRANVYKNKFDNEMGKLREFENEALYWKKEFDNLQRRVELDGGSTLINDESRKTLNAAREEIEALRRRESAVQYDLDQARHAITNLKGHHDFIMRERDAQQEMEKEKIVLEWQTKLAEVENRYKGQVRRAMDDLEVLKTECDILQRKIQQANGEDKISREQSVSIQREYERERREWQLSATLLEDGMEEERRQFGREKRDLEEQYRMETTRLQEEMEEKFGSSSKGYEDQIKELRAEKDSMTRLLKEKEEDFEDRLKVKVVEWKSEWDLAEDVLKEEIKKLKSENQSMKSELNLNKGRKDRAAVEFQQRIDELEEELKAKDKEQEIKTKNLKVRLNAVENEKLQTEDEQKDLENQLKSEKERHREAMKAASEASRTLKAELLERISLLEESERMLKEERKHILQVNEDLLKEQEKMAKEFKEKEKKWQEKSEKDLKAMEQKAKQKLEKTWINKLKKSEETAAQDMTKLKEAQNRTQSELRRMLETSQKSDEDSRRLIEEFKKKVKQLRQNEAELNRRISDFEEQLQECSRKDESSSDEHKKELAALDERYQKQVDQLTIALAQKQNEVSQLREQEEKLQAAQSEPSESNALVMKIEELNYEIRRKEAEIQASSKVHDLECRIQTLEAKLEIAESQKKEIEKSLNDIESERDEEMKIIQDALDEAASEREELITTFEKELERLNKINATREHQLMEDFEWKLREIEKDHKKKLEDKERMTEDRIKTVRTVVESELADSITKVAEDRRIADQQLTEVGYLKSYEAEAIQLRGVTHELQKALRASAREMENMKIREKIMDEEIRSLKKGGGCLIQTSLQRVKRQMDEDDFRQKLEKMKNEINAEWEDKLRKECSRLKAELDELHSEEKHLAVESMKVQKEQESQTLKKAWEMKQEELNKEISTLKDSLTDKDAYYHKELENLRTSADRDIWELRRKLQRLDETSYDKQQQMEEKHREDMERLRVDYEDGVKELERRLSLAEGDMTLSVRSEIEKMYKGQIEYLGEQHRMSMERLREELECDKFQAVEDARVILSERHECINSSLRQQLTEALTANAQCREELNAVRGALNRRDEAIRMYEEENSRLRELYGIEMPSQSFAEGTPYSPSNDSPSSSRNSQDRLSLSESNDFPDEPHKSRVTFC